VLASVMIDYTALAALIEAHRVHPPFSDLSSTVVPGEGHNPKAFILGGIVSAQSVIAQRPFADESGLIVRNLMTFAGLYMFNSATPAEPLRKNANCWLTHTLKRRAPMGAEPTIEQIKAARSFIHHEWLAVGSPPIIITIGDVALYTILNRLRSSLQWAGRTRKAPGIFAPAYLCIMANPKHAIANHAMKVTIEDDWKRLGEWIHNG
jgi:uracil-DNA glycosylase family 4